MVETIRALCKSKGTSLTKLEQKLGFGNGVIGRWDKSRPSYDRLKKVADALDVTVGELLGEQQKKPTTESGGPVKQRLFEESEDLSEEEAALILAQVRKLKDIRM